MAHKRLDPLASICNQENALQTCPQADLTEAIAHSAGVDSQDWSPESQCESLDAIVFVEYQGRKCA